MSLVMRQGLDAARLLVNFDSGELVWTTDTNQLYVGDGSTLGGLDVLGGLHNHDARYYLQGTVDTLLGDKLDSSTYSGHVSNLGVHRQINDVGTTLTDLWSASKILASLVGKAPLVHNHNSLYYTKLEIDGMSSSDEMVQVNGTDSAPGFLSDKVAGGDGVTVFLNTTDFPDNRLEFISEVYIDTINGMPMPVYKNTAKGNKILSVCSVPYIWSEGRLGGSDWCEIGTARHTLNGHIMPYDGTIVGMTYHISDTNSGSTNLRMYKNAGIIHTFPITTTGQLTGTDMTLNLDFNAGDKLRWKNDGNVVESTVLVLLIHWRKA